MKNALFIAARASTLALLIGSAVSTPAAWALSVSPARTELSLPPGGMMETVITVANPHAEPFDVELSEKPWFVLPENSKIQVQDWLKLPHKDHFRLKPGKSRDIKITVECPKNAVGELMGMVSFAYQSLTPGMVTPMISAPVYLHVTGTEKNLGEITALGAGNRNGQFQVGVQVKASGNVRLRPVGTIRLLDEKGVQVSEYGVPEATPIFPGQTHDCATKGSMDAPKAGRYTLAADLHSGSLELKQEQRIQIKSNGDVELEK